MLSVHHLMSWVVQTGHSQTVFAVPANFSNDASSYNFTSHTVDEFLVKQRLTQCVLTQPTCLQT